MIQRPERARALRAQAVGDAVGRWATRIVLAITLLFLAIPALLVFVLSFSSSQFIEFPPPAWGFDQYIALFQSARWLDAIGVSIRIAVPVALLTISIAVPATLVINRTTMPARNAAYMLGVSSLLFPGAAFAVALFGVFSQFGLTSTYLGIVLSHTVLALPIALIVLSTAIGRVPRQLELVAMSLGASRLRAWAGVTIRLLGPAVGASALFAFVTSFDEAVLITFLGGPGLVTVPKAIFDSVRFGVEPVITAIATLTFVVTGLCATIASRVNSRSK